MSNKYWINKHGERFALKDYNSAYFAINAESMMYNQFRYRYPNTTCIGDKTYAKVAKDAIRSNIMTSVMYNTLRK